MNVTRVYRPEGQLNRILFYIFYTRSPSEQGDAHNTNTGAHQLETNTEKTSVKKKPSTFIEVTVENKMALERMKNKNTIWKTESLMRQLAH